MIILGKYHCDKSDSFTLASPFLFIHSLRKEGNSKGIYNHGKQRERSSRRVRMRKGVDKIRKREEKNLEKVCSEREKRREE